MISIIELDYDQGNYFFTSKLTHFDLYNQNFDKFGQIMTIKPQL